MRTTGGKGSKRWAFAVLLLAGAPLLAAWGSTPSSQSARDMSSHTVSGGVVSMAEGAQGTPNYIMPFHPSEYSSLANNELTNLIWPNLYFNESGPGGQGISEPLSLAEPPVFSHNDSVVTVTLKNYKWSDGTPVSSRDIVFFMNLLKANKLSWNAYVPGNMPGNIVSYRATSPRTVVFHLTGSFNPVWFTEDQLSEIVPLPQQAWDKTSTSSPVGNYDETTHGAVAVYNYLFKQGQDIASYDTNPLWRVVDGPWALSTFDTNGTVTLVPNRQFSGPDKPKISKFELLSFTSDSSEYSTLLSGQMSVGYVPATDIASKGQATAAGFNLVTSYIEATNFLSLNYDSPVTGRLVKQLYLREALNHLMNQAQVVKVLLSGAGYADYGPIPPRPTSPYAAPIQRTDPFPFSIAAARKLLTSHGWHIPSSGAATCAKPGTGSSECGPGVAAGTHLTFQLIYASGSAYLTGEMENFKSSASLAGIVLNLSALPFNSIVSAICGTAECDSPGWQIANWGVGFANQFSGAYPTGGNVFLGHVGLDYPAPAELRHLIELTHTAPASRAVSVMQQYDTYLTRQAPVVWQPLTDYVNAVVHNLRGLVFYASGMISPQNWYFVK